MNWWKPANLNKGLPSSIEVFVSNTSWTAGVPLYSTYALIDLSDPDISFKVDYGNKTKPALTPMEYYKEEMSKDTPYIVLNGGYFDMSTGDTLGLLIHDDNLIHINTVNEGTYHPTIGSFGMYDNKNIEATWTYNIEDKNRTTYSYPQPAPDDPNKPPLPEPNATYPAGGKVWNVKEGVSAGPLLLKDGQYYTGVEEMFTSYILDERHPRSAICKTSDNKLVFFAADGRLSFSVGLYLNESAAILSSLGCVDAINLDGGGSTCMISQGLEVNHPSGGSERPVANAVMVYNIKPK